jgi:D-alanyl-D-alanine carboxypeptidase
MITSWTRRWYALAVVVLLCCPKAASATQADADLGKRIETYAAAQAKAGQFSGVVLLARRGSTIYSGAFGLASEEFDVPNTLDTAFNLGSIDKIMTRIAVEQLVEQGRLRYDQTIGELLHDYPNAAAKAVTVMQLVAMTSGIGDFFGPAFLATPKDKIRALADYLPLFADKPLAFAPGSQRQYSNGGYVVLGLIIERVTKQSYYDYVQTHIFDPAGMTRSGWPERDVPTKGLATGYTDATNDDPAAPRRNNIYTAPAKGSSAGGGYATAADLVKFAAALQADKLLAPGAAQKLFGGSIGVAGGAPGINADLEIDAQSGYVLVVLSNYDPPSAEDVAKTIRGWIGLD